MARAESRRQSLKGRARWAEQRGPNQKGRAKILPRQVDRGPSHKRNIEGGPIRGAGLSGPIQVGLSEWAGPSGPVLGEADLRWAIVGADPRWADSRGRVRGMLIRALLGDEAVSNRLSREGRAEGAKRKGPTRVGRFKGADPKMVKPREPSGRGRVQVADPRRPIRGRQA